jgi:hypothetical protein
MSAARLSSACMALRISRSERTLMACKQEWVTRLPLAASFEPLRPPRRRTTWAVISTGTNLSDDEEDEDYGASSFFH